MHLLYFIFPHLQTSKVFIIGVAFVNIIEIALLACLWTLSDVGMRYSVAKCGQIQLNETTVDSCGKAVSLLLAWQGYVGSALLSSCDSPAVLIEMVVILGVGRNAGMLLCVCIHVLHYL